MLAANEGPLQKQEPLEQGEALLLVAEICNTAVAVSRAASDGGEKLEAMAAFERVLARTSLTADDLLRIWAVFMLGAQAVKQRHRALVEHTSMWLIATGPWGSAIGLAATGVLPVAY